MSRWCVWRADRRGGMRRMRRKRRRSNSNHFSLGACRSLWQHVAPCWAPADITPVEAKRECVCVFVASGMLVGYGAVSYISRECWKKKRWSILLAECSSSAQDFFMIYLLLDKSKQKEEKKKLKLLKQIMATPIRSPNHISGWIKLDWDLNRCMTVSCLLLPAVCVGLSSSCQLNISCSLSWLSSFN